MAVRNAAIGRTVMPVIRFPVHLLPPIVAAGRLRYHSARLNKECPSLRPELAPHCYFPDSVAGGSKRHIHSSRIV